MQERNPVPAPTPNHKQQETADRAERIQAAITTLESKIRQIVQEGEVAPKGCYVARYQARGQRGAYWYYKLQTGIGLVPFVSHFCQSTSSLQ